MFPRRWQQQVEWPACLIAFRVQWRGKMTRKLRSQHREEEEEEDDQYGLLSSPDSYSQVFQLTGSSNTCWKPCQVEMTVTQTCI
jgi:hypothetical protein